MMEREKFIELLSKKYAKELSEEEAGLLDSVIKTNEEYSLLSLNLNSYFQNIGEDKPNATELSKVWDKINAAQGGDFKEKFDHSQPKTKPFIYTSFAKIAAIFLVLVSTGLLIAYYAQKYDQDVKTLTTENHKTFKLLDDGTKVWLNKNSTLSYNEAFGKEKREIVLEGEAYFDVVKNSAIPLFVHARNIDIEVKGTAFNVNAYKENANIQVALVRGAIEVSDKLNAKHKVLLKPNEKLVFSAYATAQNNFSVIPLAISALEKDIKWTADTLTFSKEKLKDLVLRMEKKYDLKISIQSDQLKEKRFSGTFTTETIQQALEALKLSYPLTYTISNRLVVIKD